MNNQTMLTIFAQNYPIQKKEKEITQFKIQI